MITSNEINELSAALSKAQGKIVGAVKDSANPFFRSKYADLATCWDACREQLSSNGLSVIQGCEAGDGFLAVTTRLMHSSGQYVESTLRVHPKDDSPQAYGSAITYARRYALAAMVGLAQVDDDAEAAQGRNKQPESKHSPVEELTKDMSPLEVKQASVTAEQMKDILGRDVFDEEKCLAVADLHDTLRTQDRLYTAASKFLQSTDRSYWKKLVALAYQKEHAEPRANGRI